MPEERAGLPIKPFRNVAAFERWLDRNYASAEGVWLKIGKKANPERSISYDEAVEVALCFGWIDGLINKYDDLWYLQRFTPRRPRSIWSQTNCERVERLVASERMRPAGLAQVEAAKADGRWERAYPGSASATVPDDLQDALNAEPTAARAFAALSRQDRYSILFGLHNAKLPETRARRIAESVQQLVAGVPIVTIGPPKQK